MVDFLIFVVVVQFGIIILQLMPSSFGWLVFFNVFIRRKHSPADKSNRINHFRLVWFALTREDLFVDTFPWMKQDEYDNISK